MRGKRSVEEPDSPSQRCTSLAQIVAALVRTSSAPGSSSSGTGTAAISSGSLWPTSSAARQLAGTFAIVVVPFPWDGI